MTAAPQLVEVFGCELFGNAPKPRVWRVLYSTCNAGLVWLCWAGRLRAAKRPLVYSRSGQCARGRSVSAPTGAVGAGTYMCGLYSVKVDLTRDARVLLRPIVDPVSFVEVSGEPIYETFLFPRVCNSSRE